MNKPNCPTYEEFVEEQIKRFNQGDYLYLRQDHSDLTYYFTGCSKESAFSQIVGRSYKPVPLTQQTLRLIK